MQTLTKDAITKAKLIECKNWNWQELLGKKELLNDRINKLTNSLGRKNKIAGEVGKKLALHSKYPLPKTSEFKGLWDYLTENAIDLIEG